MKSNSVTRAVGAAFRAMFGGSKPQGFVSSANVHSLDEARAILGEQDRAEGARIRAAAAVPTLATEKDGRLYAIALLEKMEDEISEEESGAGFSSWSANADGADQDGATMMIFRSGPQYGALLAAFDDLSKYATREAVKGFHVVFTDFIGGTISGAVSNSTIYSEREQAGALEPWGSVNFTHPEAAKAALQEGGRVISYAIPGKQPATPKRKQTDAEKLAAKMLSDSFVTVYALDDLARRYKSSGLSFLTIRAAVFGLSHELRGQLASCATTLPPKHGAQKHGRQAGLFVDGLCETLDNASEENDANTPRRIVGAALLAIVQSIGAEIERAEIACGQLQGTAGYLGGNASDPSAEVKARVK